MSAAMTDGMPRRNDAQCQRGNATGTHAQRSGHSSTETQAQPSPIPLAPAMSAIGAAVSVRHGGASAMMSRARWCARSATGTAQISRRPQREPTAPAADVD
jgi:hypothetical protein